MLWNWNWERLQCGAEYKRCWKRNVEILGNKKTGQGLSEELGKYIWLAKADTSQEAPASESGSSSRKTDFPEGNNLEILETGEINKK